MSQQPNIKLMNSAIDKLFDVFATEKGIQLMQDSVQKFVKGDQTTVRYPFVDAFLQEHHDLPCKVHVLIQILIYMLTILVKKVLKMQRRHQRKKRLQKANKNNKFIV